MKLNSLQKSRPSRRVLSILVALIIAVVGGVSGVAWLQSRDKVDKVDRSATQTSTRSDGDGKQAQEGKIETSVDSESIASYTVAPDKPRALYIDKLGGSITNTPHGGK